MHPLSGFGRLAAAGLVGLAALGIAGCASMTVNSYVERGVTLTEYRTYNWAPADERTTGDPRLDNNPFFQNRLRSDVDAQLTRRGFDKATSAPDLLVHYHATVGQQVDINDVDRLSGYCGAGDCQPSVYEAGTLVIDLVDTRTNRVVWRGWAEGSVDGVVDNQDWMEEKLDLIVARIMERLPRRS